MHTGTTRTLSLTNHRLVSQQHLCRLHLPEHLVAVFRQHGLARAGVDVVGPVTRVPQSLAERLGEVEEGQQQAVLLLLAAVEQGPERSNGKG